MNVCKFSCFRPVLLRLIYDTVAYHIRYCQCSVFVQTNTVFLIPFRMFLTVAVKIQNRQLILFTNGFDRIFDFFYSFALSSISVLPSDCIIGGVTSQISGLLFKS